MATDPSPALPVAAQYLATFLKPEMWHIYRPIRALRAFRPVVICQKRENVAQFPLEDVRVVPKPATHPWRRFWQRTLRGRPIVIYRSEARRIAAALAEMQARVLHIYFGHMAVHLEPLFDELSLPVVVSFHGADAGVGHGQAAYRELSRSALGRARLILARSESLAAQLPALGCDPANIRLHRTGLPLGEFAFTQREAPTSGAWHCVQACRLIAKKGLATSLRAFATLAREYPQARLTIAGEGPLREDLLALAGELGLGEKVRFAGFLPQSALRALFRDAHFFLHPSEMGPDGDQEGIPNSMIEAMAVGLPVLATRHAGIPEAVEDGVSGVLVREGDDAALSQGLRALTRDPARYAAMSRAAGQGARMGFDLDTQTRLLEGYYREAISGPA